jgi:hypothetical protein
MIKSVKLATIIKKNLNSVLLNRFPGRLFITARYSKVKLILERKQNRIQIYSMNGEWKNSAESLCGEKPPVAVVHMA